MVTSSPAGGVAEAEHLAELRCSVLVEDEIRPPFFRRHRADLSTAIGGVVGLMPHGGPVAVVRRCRRQQRTAFSFTASGRRRARARPAAAGVQTECQQQRRRQRKIFSAHSVIPMHPAPRPADSCMASSFLASFVRLPKGFAAPADAEHESPESIKTVIDECGSSFRCRRIWCSHDRWRPPWRTSMPSGSRSRPQRFEAHRYGCGYRSDPRCVPAGGR